MKKVFSIFITALFIILLSSCTKKLQIKNIDIVHEEEFGGVYIKKEIDEFNKLGFSFGDSVNIKFSNGYTLKDQPYFNGYYVNPNESLLVGYPGYDYIKACINYGSDLWIVANLDESIKATVTLSKKGKYKKVQEASDISYNDDRNSYTTDSEFANYREIKVGNIKSGILFRSASPCDNKHKRAHYTDTLMEESQVVFILNLADTKEKIDSYIAKDDFNSPYFLSLYQSNKFYLSFANDEKVDPIALNMNYQSEEFRNKVALGFRAMLSSDGPYLIHCLEGKDRTGFVCMIIEALMNATYTQIVDDYMLTYENYYGIDKNDSRYEIIKSRNIDAMLKFITSDKDYTKIDLSTYAKDYLIKGGLTNDEVTSLINKLK